jgi:hypothetical protein
MSKCVVNLTLVELYAIKHALIKQVIQKNKRLEDICTESIPADWDSELEEEFTKLNKDVEHERALVNMFEREIISYKQAKRI